MHTSRFNEILGAVRLLSSIEDNEQLPSLLVKLATELAGAARGALVLDKRTDWAAELPRNTGAIDQNELAWMRQKVENQESYPNEEYPREIVRFAVGDVIEGYLYVASDQGAELLQEDGLSVLTLLSLHASSVMERNYSRQLLKEQKKRRQDFTSMVTHQLRLPMTSIGGYADLLASGATGALQDRQLEFMARIKRNIDRMNDLLSALSEMSQIQSRAKKYNKQAVDLNSCISAVNSLLQQEFESRQQRVAIDLPADLPPASADVKAVKRVLKVLMTNAARYTPPGGAINIQGHVVESMLAVSVIDNGIGITEGDQENIFTPFFRADDPVVREHVGWGLELALAKMIIEAQEGSLSFNSVHGEGSTFSITLPTAD